MISFHALVLHEEAGKVVPRLEGSTSGCRKAR